MRESEIRVGISSSLLGNPVRFDGGHKLDHYLRDTLGAYVAWVPICPEVESGLPVPREALRESFRRGLIPLIVPVTLLAHYTRIYGEPWLERQHYLRLEPRELMLRNHV